MLVDLCINPSIISTVYVYMYMYMYVYHRLVNASPSVRASLEVKAADYQVGWNDGHDILYGATDNRRAVFSANPLFDTPYEQFAAAKKFPLFSTPNVTPLPSSPLTPHHSRIID